MGLQKTGIGQQGLCHLGKGNPQRKRGHVLAAGKVVVHHMVGAFQILDVRKGQGPQAHSRCDRDDRAVFRLGGPVQQGCQLLRTERDMQVLHRVHPERFVGIGRGVGQKGQRGPHTPAAQLCRRLQAAARVGGGQLNEVELVPGARFLLLQQGRRAFQLLHDAGIGPAGIIFHAVALHPAPQHRVRAAHRNVKDHIRSSFPSAQRLIFAP